MSKKPEQWHNIVDVLDDFGLLEQDIEKLMVLVATMGSSLRPGEVYVVYEELTDLISHKLKVIGWLWSWPNHIRECLEKYPIEWFGTQENCFAFYYNYMAFYLQVQKIAVAETGIKIK